ncbi:hypothetical protein ABFX02_07G095900 [Erythranthe guttata]
MKNLINFLTLLACIFLTIFPTTITGLCLTDKYRVHVVNRLPNPPMRLHCASGDNDLGYHSTPTNYDFNWSFCVNYFSTTVFFCTVEWTNKRASFDVFNSKLVEGCSDGSCYFEVKEDAIYFASRPKYPWTISST